MVRPSAPFSLQLPGLGSGVHRLLAGGKRSWVRPQRRLPPTQTGPRPNLTLKCYCCTANAVLPWREPLGGVYPPSLPCRKEEVFLSTA
jgi:hypothetical protein